MLAVFNKSVAKSPEDLFGPRSDDTACSALKDGVVLRHFRFVYPRSDVLTLDSTAILALPQSDENLSHLRLRRSFMSGDDIFCLFRGCINNMEKLKEQYGLDIHVDVTTIVIEAYRALRDRGPFPVEQVMRDFEGKFVFILFDNSSKVVSIASNADESIPLHWGVDSEGHLVLSDEEETMKKGCGNSFAVFPKGCFFTSSGGLRSIEHPMNEMKAIPRVDIAGDVNGASSAVDLQISEMKAISRVDIAGDVNEASSAVDLQISEMKAISRVDIAGDVNEASSGVDLQISEMKAIPRVDIAGDVNGASSAVDLQISEMKAIPKVDIVGDINGASSAMDLQISEMKAIPMVDIAGDVNEASSAVDLQISEMKAIPRVDIAGDVNEASSTVDL